MFIFQLSIQFIFGLLQLFIMVYLIVPWFVKLNGNQQAIVAVGSPLLGAFFKMISRIITQRTTPKKNHPGNTYVFVVVVYSGVALFYRALQAELQSFYYFTILSFVHALVGILERLTVVFRDHFYVWFCKKVLKREQDFESYIGSFRTPRTQRLIADLIICNVIHEITAIVYTNSFVQLYGLQIRKNITDIDLGTEKVLKEIVKRTMVALGTEYICSAFGVFVLTWYLNIPIVRVWKSQWKSLIFSNFVVVSFLVMYFTGYMASVVSSKYNSHLQKNDTHACIQSDLLFFS